MLTKQDYDNLDKYTNNKEYIHGRVAKYNDENGTNYYNQFELLDKLFGFLRAKTLSSILDVQTNSLYKINQRLKEYKERLCNG